MPKMVSAAFMQHCVQSNVTHFTHVEGVEVVKDYELYSVYSGLLLLWEGRPVQPSILWI